MPVAFFSLIKQFTKQLTELTGRLFRYTPLGLSVAIPTVVINQVSFVLAFMLPLKIFILMATERVPRYLRFFVTEETRDQWIVYLLLATVGFYILYLVTNNVLKRLGQYGAERIRIRSDKVTLFNAEQEFASTVFLRVCGTWATVIMAVGALLLGFILEWRMAVAMIVAVSLQMVGLAWHWNRHQAPEQAEAREAFVSKRMAILQSLAGINTFIAFGVLVALHFTTEGGLNFLIAIVLFILTRQVLMRMIQGINDGYFLAQQRERIDALVYPERQVKAQRKASEVSFESLLMPSHRHKVFDAIAKYDLGIDLSDQREWRWCDCGPRGHALYVSAAPAPDQLELRLKVLSSSKDAGLAREALFHESESSQMLDLSPRMLATGNVYGRGFLLLASEPLSACSGQQLVEAQKEVRYALWQHPVEQALAQRLSRSYAALDQRIDAERYGRIRLGCNASEEEALLDEFLNSLDVIQSLIETLPKVLVNKDLSAANVMVTESGQPRVMHWNAIAYDVMGSGLSIKDLSGDYPPEAILAELSQRGMDVDHIEPRAIELATHITHLDGLVAKEAYAAALQALPEVLARLAMPEQTAQRVAS